MAFLDNSGDIILDAVLTDTGRARLAKGDGTFKIVKYALGDDEIDYSLFNSSHASGSAYYDLDIMQTPLLEAFTNNTSSMKHKLISIPRTNLLYLPVLRLNEVYEPGTNSRVTAASPAPTGTYVVACDKDTEDKLTASTATLSDKKGVLLGENPSSGGAYVRVDQGLDTVAIPPSNKISPDLTETQYIIQIDNRFGSIVSLDGVAATVSYIDDDSIASYYLSLGSDVAHVYDNEETETSTGQVIDGPRGTYIKFRVASSIELGTSSHLFTTLGGGPTIKMTIDTNDYYYIDSYIRVTGATTGHSIDIPVRFAKYFTS
jgi:hypothetical protein